MMKVDVATPPFCLEVEVMKNEYFNEEKYTTYVIFLTLKATERQKFGRSTLLYIMHVPIRSSHAWNLGIVFAYNLIDLH